MSSQRVAVLTDGLTERIYDILERCCGAYGEGRGEFVAYMRRERDGEWRFGGWLGFGGKLFSNSRGVYVDCYAEHKSPLAAFAIKTANERISALLGHPEGITDTQLHAACEVVHRYLDGGFGEVERPGPSDVQSLVENVVAALFPGEDERMIRSSGHDSEGRCEWRAFVGDEGESNDYARVRATRAEAEADLADLTRNAAEDDPYDRQGVEYRQCGPWVEVSRPVGQVNG